MPKKAKDVASALKKKGFKEDSARDHIFYYLYNNGKRTQVYTKISHGAKEISDVNLGKMKRQMRFRNRKDFDDYIKCNLSEDEYKRLLKEENVI